MANKNPRGQTRPQDGHGKGTGMAGGQRQGKNTGGCKTGKAGKGTGQGQGKGTNRKG